MRHDVLEAYVEGGVGVGGEDGALLADDIFRLAVLVDYVISDLHPSQPRVSWCSMSCNSYIMYKKLVGGMQHTRMLTIMPSPLLPPTVAVTTTKVSLATKFRMHRSTFLSLGPRAVRSNFKALTDAIRSTRPQMYCSNARGKAIVLYLLWAEEYYPLVLSKKRKGDYLLLHVHVCT